VSRIILSIVSAAMILCSCGNEHNPAASGAITDSVASYSSRLVIEKITGATRITVRDPWQNAEGTAFCWYLVPRDSALPDGISEKQTIRVPVRRMICMSTTHAAMMRALDATDLIVGVSGPSLVYDSLLLERISNGIVRDVGYENNLNRELVISLEPDLLMAYGVADPSSGSTGRLTDSGVKVFYNADYLEQHPLARCEWLRLFGLLTGRERMADSIVSTVTGRYHELTGKVRSITGDRPGVLLGAPWEDVWYVSPGNSYIGQLVDDAGGNYIFSDLTAPHSVPFSVESVFRKAGKADIWINPGTADSLSEIATADHRLESLPLLRHGKVWNNRRRITPEGGNDYWESAVVRPDLLLMDFVSIIHPELLPGYDQTFYIRLQ
jgi:iron complex transport system substrate-binding protein